MTHGHVKPNPDGSKARCGGPGICPECSIELAEQTASKQNELLDIIEKWQFAWMNVKGTDGADASRYHRRASGIDANMRYDLAHRLMKAGKP